MGPKGEIYVSVVVEQNTWCLRNPLKRCCQVTGPSTSVFQLRLPSNRWMKLSFKEVFNTKSFRGPSGFEQDYFHMKGMDVTADGDIVVVGFGDDGAYWAHSAWLWDIKRGEARRIAGTAVGEGGKSGDGGNATNATMELPWGVLAKGGNILISEAGNSDIRQVVG